MKITNAKFGYEKSIVEIKNLSIKPGEVVAIVGKSGIGKSTIFKTLAGINNIIEGEIIYNEEKVSKNWLKNNVRLILQNFPLLHWLTVKENLLLATSLSKINISEEEISKKLKEVSAEHLSDKYPHSLSGGERCRASLVQASLNSPKLLLLDEPFTGLDVIVKDSVAQNIFNFAQKNQTPVLYITHDLFDACTYASRVIVIAGDKIAEIKNEFEIKNPEEALKLVHQELKKYA